MLDWTIKVFVADVERWLNGQTPEARAKIEARIRYLEVISEWKPPYVVKLTGYADLYEIRVIHSNKQYRLIGCYGPGKREFTILVGAIEKEGKYNPPSVFETAERRIKLILKNEGYTYEY